MNRRKRRKSRAAKSALVPAPALGLGVAVVTLAMLYLWLDHTCSALGQQIRELEMARVELRNQWARENNRWTSMRTPASLDQALLRHGLVMGTARPEQIVQVRRRPVAGLRYQGYEMLARMDR